MASFKLLDAATEAAISSSVETEQLQGAPIAPNQTFQATISGSGAVSATVLIQFSNDLISWLTGATITLAGTNLDSDGFASTAKWKYLRANLTAISGTNAECTVTLGV